MATFKDHFSQSSAEYSTYRPSYPAEFIAAIAGLCSHHNLAWDVGTGSGQAAILLADHFDDVVATDASEQQIANAQSHHRISYSVAKENQSDLVDHSVDLVTVAQALHWFDCPAFYAEADRVLKHGGVLAVWTYGNAIIDSVIDPPFEEFYSQRVGRYWPAERKHVLVGYRDLPFPYSEHDLGNWQTTANLTRQEFLGYVGTWSAIANARKAENADPVLELARQLEPIWPDGERKLITWPIAARVGRKP